MSNGPFEGLELVEKAAMIARALMGYGPADLDYAVHWRLVLDLAKRSDPALIGRWIGTRSPRGVRYTRVTAEAGESRAALREGETAALMLESPEPTAVRDWLARFATAYERGVYGEPDAAAADRLLRTVYACEPGFHATMMALVGQLASPELFLRHVQTLKALFGERCVDAALFGSIAGTYELGAVTGWPRPLVELLPAPPPEPRALLRAAVSAAVGAGLEDRVRELGDSWRDAVDEETEKARAAASPEAALEIIYRALPRATAAVDLYRALGEHWSRVAGSVDERRVRLRHALSESILDFSGRRWRELRGEVANLRVREGDEAATRRARSFTDRHLLYPRLLLDDLLSGEPVTGPRVMPPGEALIENVLLAHVFDDPDVREGLKSEPFDRPVAPVRSLAD